MSAALLYWARLHIAVEDEVESFFYIIVYAGVRYLRSNVPDARPFLRSFFEAYELVNNEYRCGAKKMDSMQSGRISTGDGRLRFRRTDRAALHPLDIIMADMLPLFQARYAQIEHDREELVWRKANNLQSSKKTSTSTKLMPPLPLDQSVIDSAARLKTHTHFKALLRRLLEEDDWPTADHVGDLLAIPVIVETAGDTSGGDNEEDEAGADQSSSDYDSERDPSPSARRVKARHASEELESDSDGPGEEEPRMDVDQPSTSTSRSGRYAASRSSGRGATMRGTTRRARRA